MEKKRFLAVILFCTVLSVFTWDKASAEVTVIANSQVRDETLTQKELKMIYLGKKIKWGDGTKIVFVTQDENRVHQEFLDLYVGKTPSQFRYFWKKNLFSGSGMPPKNFDSQEALVRFVSSTKGAIGYIEGNPEAANIKTITIRD